MLRQHRLPQPVLIGRLRMMLPVAAGPGLLQVAVRPEEHRADAARRQDPVEERVVRVHPQADLEGGAPDLREVRLELHDRAPDVVALVLEELGGGDLLAQHAVIREQMPG